MGVKGFRSVKRSATSKRCDGTRRSGKSEEVWVGLRNTTRTFASLINSLPLPALHQNKASLHTTQLAGGWTVRLHVGVIWPSRSTKTSLFPGMAMNMIGAVLVCEETKKNALHKQPAFPLSFFCIPVNTRCGMTKNQRTPSKGSIRIKCTMLLILHGNEVRKNFLQSDGVIVCLFKNGLSKLRSLANC